MIRVHGTLNPRIVDLDKILDLDAPAIRDATVAADAMFRRHELESFNTEGASSGGSWKPLSPRYRRWKDRLFAGATAQIREQARARGRRISVSSRRGSDNKILQLTGDLKRAFSQQGGGTGLSGVPYQHIADHFRGVRGWIIRLGAQGDAYFKFVGDKGRDPIQHTDEQFRAYSVAVSKALVPHVLRRFKALQVARRLRAA